MMHKHEINNEAYDADNLSLEREVRRQIAEAAHPVLMPEVRSLDELFERIDVVHDLHKYRSEAAHIWNLKPRGSCQLDTFCGIRGVPFSLDVDPRPEVVELVGRHMLLSDGYRFNFQITLRGEAGPNQCALVACVTSQIIASRWLAIIPASEIRRLSE